MVPDTIQNSDKKFDIGNNKADISVDEHEIHEDADFWDYENHVQEQSNQSETEMKMSTRAYSVLIYWPDDDKHYEGIIRNIYRNEQEKYFKMMVRVSFLI